MQQITFSGGPLDGRTLGLILLPGSERVNVQARLEFGHEKSVLHELEYLVFPGGRAQWPLDSSEITKDEEGRPLTGVQVA